jgi:tetratricopeptide (TPR) repeat protein
MMPGAPAPQPPIALDRLGLAVQHHEQGRLAEAEAFYAAILADDPGDFDALHLLGVLRLQQGRAQDALARISEALARRPSSAEAHSNLGLALQALGRSAEALASYERALALRPQYAAAHNHRGMALHALGRPAEALACYERALELQPHHVKALNNRGMALQTLGRPEEALACYEQALALDPDFPEALRNRGIAFQLLGRLDDALPSFDRLAALRPDDPDAQLRRGKLLHFLWRPQQALACYERALELQPGDAEALNGRGAALYRLGRLREALGAFDAVLAADPDHAGALYNRGVVLEDLGLVQEAVACYDRVLALHPGDVEGLGKRGAALAKLGRGEEGLESCRSALALRPGDPGALYNHALVLYRLDRFEEALAAYDATLAAEPRHLLAHSNRGSTLNELNRHGEAIESFQRAQALCPDVPEVRWNEGLSRLVLGELELGWPLFESRWGMRAFYRGPDPSQGKAWRGEEQLAGRTILLCAEQGLGDTVHFARYVPLVAARGGRVLLEVQPELKALLVGLRGVERVFGRDEALPGAELHCPLLSLPLAFGTSLGSIPAEVPYLAAPPDRVARWARRLGAPRGPRIGLCWSGSPQHQGDRRRSVPLERLLPLTRIPGLELVSVQKEVRDADRPALEASGIRHFGGEIDDLADAAALISLLDLVVTVDTVAAHLAGALARPVWVMLPFSPDWRWLMEREDSPWYPTARLFRLPRIGAWDEVVARVAAELGRMAAPSGPRSGQP